MWRRKQFLVLEAFFKTEKVESFASPLEQFGLHAEIFQSRLERLDWSEVYDVIIEASM